MPDRLCKLRKEEGGIAILSVPGAVSASPGLLLEALQHHLAGIANNADISGVILTGAGADFFICSEKGGMSVSDAAAVSAFGQQIMFNIEKVGRPFIAVIEQNCSGIGFEAALACDFIVASNCSSFGFPEISEGRIPFCGGSQRLARLVGKSKAKEMIFSGEMIDAEEASRIGLINRLLPQGEALPHAESLLRRICSRSQNAIRVGGEVINAGYDIDLHTACMLERNAFALCFSSFDQREGMQAFLDKREPQFRGE